MPPGPSGAVSTSKLLAQPRGDRVRDDALVLEHDDARALHGGKGTAGLSACGGWRLAV